MAGQQSCRLADGQLLGHGRRGLAAGAQGLQEAAEGALATVVAQAADLPAEPDGVGAPFIPALMQVAEVGLDPVLTLAGAGGQVRLRPRKWCTGSTSSGRLARRRGEGPDM